MLDLKCDRCAADLTKPGALVFSPPGENGHAVDKYHLCVACWADILRAIVPSEASSKGWRPKAAS